MRVLITGAAGQLGRWGEEVEDLPGALAVARGPEVGEALAEGELRPLVRGGDLKLVGQVTLPALKLPGHEAISAVANWVTFTPDAKTIYVSNAAIRSVTAIDVPSMKVKAVVRVGEVAAMPLPVLCGLFGARGRVLRDQAHGIDPRTREA